ncbi:hypothetical protein PM082_011641 [Marasmius tenuissimus]|nr:hypothetical protein PM082_011641 [Marasmius tenuissimus]
MPTPSELESDIPQRRTAGDKQPGEASNIESWTDPPQSASTQQNAETLGPQRAVVDHSMLWSASLGMNFDSSMVEIV